MQHYTSSFCDCFISPTVAPELSSMFMLSSSSPSLLCICSCTSAAGRTQRGEKGQVTCVTGVGSLYIIITMTHSVKFNETNAKLTLTIRSPGFLHVPGIHGCQQPLPAEQTLTTRGAVPILHPVHVEPAALLQVLLGFGDKAEAVEEAVRLGQVRCRLPTGVP